MNPPGLSVDDVVWRISAGFFSRISDRIPPDVFVRYSSCDTLEMCGGILSEIVGVRFPVISTGNPLGMYPGIYLRILSWNLQRIPSAVHAAITS